MGRTKRIPLVQRYPRFPYEPEENMHPIDIKAQRFALNLRDTIEQFIKRGYCTSIRDFARQAGIPHTVLLSYMSGKTWIDGYSLARLETLTGRALWEPQVKSRIDRKPPMSSGKF